jgi:hypothetical protein
VIGVSFARAGMFKMAETARIKTHKEKVFPHRTFSTVDKKKKKFIERKAGLTIFDDLLP